MTDEYIGFRIDSETKQSWQEAVDESAEYRSLTHLICLAVEEELRDGDGGDASAAEVDVDLSRFHDRFDSIQRQLDTIEDRADEIYVLTRDDQSAEIMEIVGEVLDLIPEPEDVEQLLSQDPGKYDDPYEKVRRTGKVAGIFEILCGLGDYPQAEVRQAVERIDREMETVAVMDATPQAESVDKRIYRIPD